MSPEEIERKKAEIRARVAEARKKQDLEIAKREAEAAQAKAKHLNDNQQAGDAGGGNARGSGGGASAKAPQKQTPKTANTSPSNSDGVLRIDEGYADFKVLPKPDEKGNPNFPYNLHNACELFCRTGNVVRAVEVRLQTGSLTLTHL